MLTRHNSRRRPLDDASGVLLYPVRSPFNGRSFAEVGAPGGELRPVPLMTYRAAAAVRDAEGGRAGRSEVAEALGVDPAAATNLLRRAEGLGLVTHVMEKLSRGGRRHVYAATPLLRAYGEA